MVQPKFTLNPNFVSNLIRTVATHARDPKTWKKNPVINGVGGLANVTYPDEAKGLRSLIDSTVRFFD